MAHDGGKITAADGPLPIPYTAGEVYRTFTELLATFDFAVELREIGIGSLSVFKRRQAKKRFTALYVALWHVALEKSFPKDADAFFIHFLTTYPPTSGEGRSSQKMRALVLQYDTLVGEKKDTDFSGVAEHLAEAFKLDMADRARQQLKLSLRIRTIYDFIFENLI